MKCCCCIPLRTGVFIIAVLYIVINIAMVVGWAAFTGYAYHWHESDGVTHFIFITLVIMCGLNITADSLLVHDLRRNRRKLMLPWLVWYGILTALLTIAWVAFSLYLAVLFVERFLDRNKRIGVDVTFCLATWPPGMVIFPVMWYWYACVYAYYSVLAPSDAYLMQVL